MRLLVPSNDKYNENNSTNGGRGSRLRPHTFLTIPKPLISIA
jgi:hypothetical protein